MPQRKRRDGPESGLERERGEQRPAHAVGVEITADDGRTGTDALQARSLVVLQLEDLEQPGFLTRGRDDGEVAMLVVEQQPRGRDVQQADTRRGQPVEQVDDVVVFDEAVGEHHERVGQFLLAAEDDTSRADRVVSAGHGPSKRRRRSTTSRGGGGVGGGQCRGELIRRQGAGNVAVEIEGTDADEPDTQRQREYRPDSGGRDALHERGPAPGRRGTGPVQVSDHDRRAARDRLDAHALAESELKILDPGGHLVGGADDTSVTGGGHHRDASATNS